MSPALLVLVLLVAHSSAALRDGAAALEPARQARAHVCSWAFVDACSREVQDWMRQSLETDATQLLPGVKQNALELLRPAPGAVVLDVGSGLGMQRAAPVPCLPFPLLTHGRAMLACMFHRLRCAGAGGRGWGWGQGNWRGPVAVHGEGGAGARSSGGA